MAQVSVVASPSSWIEGEAVRQLERAAELPGMRRAVGMPDLHPGKGHPIGAAFLSEGVIYPHLVGGDIGCGMGMWRTDAKVRKLKVERLAERVSGMEGPWDGDTERWLAEDGVAPSGYEESLGTVGGGNHFAELQKIEEVCDPSELDKLALDPERALLLVHSGSRGFGERVLRTHTEVRGAEGLVIGSPEADTYLARHDHAVRWGQSNRRLVAARMLEAVGAEGERVLDLCHNSVTPQEEGGCACWLHRKGAAPADQGPVVIPGSRGAMSYLVAPAGDPAVGGWSLAHGAGRKWGRSDARDRLRARLSVEQLQRSPLGNPVICEDKDLLYEEAPQAYKDVDRVVQDLVDAGLARVIAVLRPMLTYKVRRRG